MIMEIFIDIKFNYMLIDKNNDKQSPQIEAQLLAEKLIECRIKLSDVSLDIKDDVLDCVNDMLLSFTPFWYGSCIKRMILRCEIDELSIDPYYRFYIR